MQSEMIVSDRGERVEHKPFVLVEQTRKPWLCCDCERRFRHEKGARRHWRDMHGWAKGGQ